jgi:hypothetical protein
MFLSLVTASSTWQLLNVSAKKKSSRNLLIKLCALCFVLCALFHSLIRKVKTIRLNRVRQTYRNKIINGIPSFNDILKNKTLSVLTGKGSCIIGRF